MALTTDDLLVRITVDQTGAIKGFKALDDSLNEISATAAKTGKSSEDEFKALDAATISVIASTQALAASMDAVGKSSFQVAQEESAARLKQLAELKDVLSLNSQLTGSMEAQIEAAQKATQAYANTKALKDNADLAKAIAAETRSIAAETEKVGKSTQGLADIEKRESLARIEQIEKQLIGEGRLTQALSAQLDAQRKAIVLRAQTKVSDADAKAIAATASATKDASSSMVSWAAAVTLANQGLEVAAKLFGFLKDTMYETVKAFRLSQDFVTRLGSTLQILGEHDIQGTVDRFKALSEELASTTTITKEQVIQFAGIGKQMGLTNDRTEELVKTAIDLAAAYNEDVGTAFDQLSQSLKGQVRGLALLRPELAGAAKDWLQAGGAVSYFSDLVKGRGSEELKTFGGQLKQNGKLLEEFKKSVGEGILLGFGIDPDAPNEIAKLAAYLEDVRDVTAKVTNVLKNMGIVAFDIAKTVGLTFSTLAVVVKNLFLDVAQSVSNNFTGIASAIANIIRGNFKQAAVDFGSAFVASTANSAAGADYMGKKFDETLNDLGKRLIGTKGGLDDVTKSVKTLDDQVRKLPKKPPLGIDENAAKESAKLLEELSRKASELRDEALKAGATMFGQIRLDGRKAIDDLFVTEVKLAKLIGKDAARLAVDPVRAIVREGVSRKLANQIKVDMNDVRKTTQGLALEQLAQLGEETDVIQAQLDITMREIDARKELLAREGDSTLELRAALEVQQQILKSVGARKKLEAELANRSPEAAAVGRAVGATLQFASSMVVKTAGLFGKELSAVTEGTVNRVIAVTASAFDKILPVAEALFMTAVSIFNPQFVNDLGDALDFLQKLPQALVDAFNRLGSIIDSIVKSLPDAIKSLLNQIPSLVQKILDALPGLINVMVNALDKIINMLPGIFQRIFDKLPAIVDQLAKALPKIIKDLFSAVGSILSSLIQALPEIIKNLLDHLPDVLEALIEGLIAAMGKVVGSIIALFYNGGAEKIVGALIRAIPRLVVAIVQGIARGLAQALGSIFNGLKIKVPGGDIGDKIAESVKKVAATAAGVSEQVFKVIDIGAAAKAKSVGDDLRNAIQSATEEMRSVFNGLMAALKAVWQWVYDHIMKPIIDGISALWTQVIKPINDALVNGLSMVWAMVKPIVDAAVGALKGAWAELGKLWTDTVKPIIDGMVGGLAAVWATFKQISDTLVSGLGTAWAALQKLWDTSVKPVVDNLTAAAGLIGGAVGQGATNLKQGLVDGLTEIKTFFGDLFKGDVSGAFKSTVDFLTNLPKTMTDGLKTKLTDLTQNLKDLGGKISDGALAGLNNGAQTFKDLGSKMFEGLSKSFNDNAQFFRDFGGKIWEGLQKGLSSVAGGGGGGGLGGVLKAAGFAAGGMIAPMYAASGMYVMSPKGSDIVPIMAQEDEAVLNRRATANLGGKPTIDALNAGASFGQRQPPAQNVEQHFEINIKVDGSKAVNEKALADEIMKKIKADSYAGIHIMSTKGLRS